MTRRDLLAGSLATAASLAPIHVLAEATKPQHSSTPLENKPTIAIVLYDGFTQLDVMGPYQFMASLMEHQAILVAKERGIVTSDSGMKIQVDRSFEDCPKDLAALIVGGGSEGTLKAMRDEKVLAFMADRGARAKHVCSVCTGSLILAAAGLLDGKRATTHWGFVDALASFGVKVVRERVVEDGKVMTGAGVSAGLDLGLALVGKLEGDEYAREVQSFIEYGPKPKYAYRDPYKPESHMDKYRPMFTELVADAKRAGDDHGAKGRAKQTP